MAAKDKKVNIENPPKLNVTGLGKPKRSETSTKQVFTAGWKYPAKAFSDKNNSRFEGVLVEWTIDYDEANSKATNGKNEKITHTRRSQKIVRAYSGSNRTSDSLEITRSEYYPCKSGKTATWVRMYVVVKKKGKKTTKRAGGVWKLQYVETSPMLLSDVNKQEKNGRVHSMAKLKKAGKGSSPVGKVFYKSKTNAAQLIKVQKKNPRLYGVGVRVQGWNSKTPTKRKVLKKKKWQVPAVATRANVLWNNNAPTQAAYFAFSVPQDPVVSAPTIADGASNHTISFPISDHDDAKNKGDDGTTAAERYDSVVKLYKTTGLYDASGNFKMSDRTLVSADSTTVKQITRTRLPNFDIGQERTVPSLRPNEYLLYDIEVVNRGVMGESKSTAKKSYLIARPHDVSIKSVLRRGELYEITFVRKKAEGGAKRKTSTYTLQRLYDYRPERGASDREVDDWSDAEWAAAAANEPDNSWTDVGVLGHGDHENWNEQTFTDLVTNADPRPFHRTYYRIVPANEIDGIDGIPSAPAVVPGFLRIPSAKDAKVDICACSSAENGNAIQAVVVFNKTTFEKVDLEVGSDIDQTTASIYELDEATGEYRRTSDEQVRAGKDYYTDLGFVNSNGTEMSWDTFENAWQSSQLPSSHDFTDEQMEGYIFPVTQEAKEQSPVLNTDRAPIGWKYTTYYIRGIQPSTKYYIKARRFLKDTETRETDSYGGYSDYTDESGENILTVETKSTPTEVKLTAPARLVEGKDLSLAWAYDSSDVQKGYQLLAYQNKPDEEKGIEAGASRTLFETGTKEDSAPYAVVPWANVEECLLGTEGSKEFLFTAVRMYTELGTWSKESDIQETRIVRAPKASLSPIPTVDAQPFSVTFGTDDDKCSIVVRLVAHQRMGWGPTGSDNTAEGSVIYSTKILSPAWQPTTLDDGTGWFYYNFDFPVLPLKDLGDYRIEYTAVNDEYDLDSDISGDDGAPVKQTVEFAVKYKEQLTVPQFYVVADPVDDEHGGVARISIMDTPGENEDCVVDLYRVTPDGAYLVHEGLSDWRNATLTDPFPPYSRHVPCVYRLAIRSQNGVVEWEDHSYAMPGYSVRFDWGSPEMEEHGQYSHLTLPYNLKWTDSWTKNSRVDLHLDGTYNGYWRGGVDHKNSLSTELVKVSGDDQIARVRALAQYSGPVMVRLPNGCAFAADVQVNNLETSYDSLTVAASYTAQEIRLPGEFGTDLVYASQGLYVPQV